MNNSIDKMWVNDLLAWYGSFQRPFPWRVNPHPYRTWICEVMSQQTTLGVVLPRYEEFVSELPHVQDLAQCSEEKLRKLWAGLGYYARARNLLKGARYIVEELTGEFPTTYEGWLKVPGCGPYTAAVIASICYHQPVACIDGNVLRVTSRLLALKDIWSTSGLREIREFVNSVVPAESPGDFNQAMMELGATLCRKQNPRCDACPIQKQCQAYALGKVDEYPSPKPRKKFIAKHLMAVVVCDISSNKVLLTKRTQGFLKGTVGFPLVEISEDLRDAKKDWNFLNAESFDFLPSAFSHTITHHQISSHILIIKVLEGSPCYENEVLTVEEQQMHWSLESGAFGELLSSSLDQKVWKSVCAYQKLTGPSKN